MTEDIIESCAPLYRGKTVLVTGGAGFIGSAVVRTLLAKTSAQVCVIDKFSYASSTAALATKDHLGRLRIYMNDLVDTPTIVDLVGRIKPDFILHLAAESHVDRSIAGPKAFIESNVLGTFSILEAARELSKTKPDVKFHHVSTDEVFGSLDDDGSFDEDSVYNPRSPYSASKAASDHLVRAWTCTYKMRTTITNCSNNFGPFQHEEKLIPTVITKALNNQPIPLYGTGTNVRDWLHVDDHVSAILLVAARGNIGETYCVGANNERTNKALVHEICAILDQRFPERGPHSRLIQQVMDRQGHDYRYAIDSTKIKKSLGWRPQGNFSAQLASTVDWYIANSGK